MERGWPGAVLGALLLADLPEMSSSEIAALLGVSGGSVSTATRELINPGVVVRVRVPGQRQDYFRSTWGVEASPSSSGCVSRSPIDGRS